MASNYSTDLKLELMTTGENAGTWGDKTNTNLNLVQQAIAGFESIALSDGGTVALAMTDATISNARNMVVKFTGTLTTASTVTIPDSIEKFYIIDLSAVTGVTNLTIKTVSGTGFTAGEAKIVAAYSDGTNLNEIALDTLGGTIGEAQLADDAVTSAKIADNAVLTANISADQVTAAKIADDAVGADQLADTAVTPGSYTTADITVDAQGRITATASGSSGGGAMEFALYSKGPSSGTYTADAAANVAIAYAMSAGGGGGAGSAASNSPGNSPNRGGNGGAGVFGIYEFPVASPFSNPYSVGGGGNGGTVTPNIGNAGGAGGTTSLANIFNITGGNGGNGTARPANQNGNPGNPGTASNSPTAASYSALAPAGAFYSDSIGTAGSGGGPGPAGGGTGGQGALFIYENTAS